MNFFKFFFWIGGIYYNFYSVNWSIEFFVICENFVLILVVDFKI